MRSLVRFCGVTIDVGPHMGPEVVLRMLFPRKNVSLGPSSWCEGFLVSLRGQKMQNPPLFAKHLISDFGPEFDRVLLHAQEKRSTCFCACMCSVVSALHFWNRLQKKLNRRPKVILKQLSNMVMFAEVWFPHRNVPLRPL